MTGNHYKSMGKHRLRPLLVNQLNTTPLHYSFVLVFVNSHINAMHTFKENDSFYTKYGKKKHRNVVYNGTIHKIQILKPWTVQHNLHMIHNKTTDINSNNRCKPDNSLIFLRLAVKEDSEREREETNKISITQQWKWEQGRLQRTQNQRVGKLETASKRI